MRSTTIPFSGFYESLHDGAIDDALNQMFWMGDNDDQCNEGLALRVFNDCDFSQVHERYAWQYVQEFSKAFDIEMEFEELSSPRFYNFTTDRIFVRVSDDTVERMYATVNEAELAHAVREQYTSRGGFISFYSPDVNAWGPTGTWDHNQIGTLMDVFVREDHFDRYTEYDLVSDFNGNGWLFNWIAEATPNFGRYDRIHRYLLKRQERTHG